MRARALPPIGRALTSLALIESLQKKHNRQPKLKQPPVEPTTALTASSLALTAVVVAEKQRLSTLWKAASKGARKSVHARYYRRRVELDRLHDQCARLDKLMAATTVQVRMQAHVQVQQREQEHKEQQVRWRALALEHAAGWLDFDSDELLQAAKALVAARGGGRAWETDVQQMWAEETRRWESTASVATARNI